MTRERATLTVEELSIVTQYPDGKRAESLTAAEFEVEVEFDFVKGYPAQTYGHADDCEPGASDEFDFRSVKLARATEFCADRVNAWYAKGYEMIGYFTAHQVEKMEEQLIQRGQQKGSE